MALGLAGAFRRGWTGPCFSQDRPRLAARPGDSGLLGLSSPEGRGVALDGQVGKADDAAVNVCHVITRMILGGAQENTLLTCEGLAARGHRVTLITGPALGPEGELVGRARGGGYDVIEMPSLRRALSAWHDSRAYRRLIALLGDLRPDVMHSHSSKAGILARAAAEKVGGMRIVHTVHGSPFHEYQSPWAHQLYVACEKWAARRTDAMIAVAEAMTRQYLAAGVGRAAQYTTIYSGMEVAPYLAAPAGAEAFRRELGLGDGDVLCTQVPRLAEVKGHEYILAIAAEVPPNVHFCFVGDGALAGAIQRKVVQLGLAGRVHLTGLLPPERIPQVMHATDVLVHCSLREGLARALPQAMLAGKPVVSFDVDGAGEVVGPDTGRLVAPKDTAALGEAVGELAGDAALRHRLGQAGRQRCRQQFDHHRMVERIEALYGRLL